LDDIAVTNITLPNTCTAAVAGVPVLVGAASRLTHSAAGTFDAPMSLNGSGVESRNASGNHTIVLHLDRAMQSGNATVMSGTGSVGSVSFSGDMLVNLNGVVDKQKLTISATNLTPVNGSVLNSVSLTLGFLVGDSTGDGTVNSGDAQQARNRSGQLTDGTNFRSDINRDGAINSGDAIIVRGRSGNSLP